MVASLSKPCHVCLHPERVAIEAAIARQESRAALADLVGVTTQALRRHEQRCLNRVVSLPSGHPERVDVQQAAIEVMQRAAELGQRAERSKDLRTALMAVREYARGAELAHKLQLDVTTRANVERDERWIVLRDAILSALEPFPDAYQAVVTALSSLR